MLIPHIFNLVSFFTKVKHPKKLIAKLSLAIILLAQLYGLSFVSPDKLASANLTSVSDTISNNRLSYRGELNGGIAVGAGIVTLDAAPTNANNTSTGSATLMDSDSVRIGTGATADVRSIKTIIDSTKFSISSGLTTAANDQDPVISTQSAIHTIRFTPVSAVPNGAFRILIQASAVKSTSGDGLPDKDGFELDASALPAVSCSGGGAGYTFVTGTASVSATQIGGTGTWYHTFECRYNGNGGTGTQVVMTVGTAAGNKVINPSPSGYTTGHNPGAGDAYDFRVQHLLGTVNSYAVNDTTLGKLYVIESVRVTATVAPTLTFMITGVASGTTCGVSNNVATDQSSVPFGSVSNSSTKNAAQILSVSTNSVGGYAVTASESGALTMLDTPANTIPDTTCAASPCTVTTTANWPPPSPTYKGFGYALDNKKGTPVAAGNLYNNGGAYMARPFGRTAESIMDNTAVADLDQAYVCYQVIISGSQAAGDYENYITYIATGRF
jgi:hypothetical protein